MHLRNRHENPESFICKCKCKWLAKEGRTSRIKISHGRKKRQKTKQKHLPRINTELHGKDRSRDTESKTHLDLSWWMASKPMDCVPWVSCFWLMRRKKKETHPAQWVGLKALIRGLGVGGRKRKKDRKREMFGITARGKRVRSRGKKKEAHPAKWMSFRSKIQSLRM